MDESSVHQKIAITYPFRGWTLVKASYADAVLESIIASTLRFINRLKDDIHSRQAFDEAMSILLEKDRALSVDVSSLNDSQTSCKEAKPGQ